MNVVQHVECVTFSTSGLCSQGLIRKRERERQRNKEKDIEKRERKTNKDKKNTEKEQVAFVQGFSFFSWLQDQL